MVSPVASSSQRVTAGAAVTMVRSVSRFEPVKLFV
jgi:hypothetical protein